MNSDMPDDAASPLASGHPPNAPASRTPLQNRVAIVTGGTGALGQAVTLRFLADGAIVAVDRKSTRLNSSHLVISYAVFCLKKKKKTPWGAAGRPYLRRNLTACFL